MKNSGLAALGGLLDHCRCLSTFFTHGKNDKIGDENRAGKKVKGREDAPAVGDETAYHRG